MKILITGAKGQLGQAFQKKFEQLNIQYTARSKLSLVAI
jgi:dTDP-4-dehydrorhamnose reductase